jgi:hypothetical protein
MSSSQMFITINDQSLSINNDWQHIPHQLMWKAELKELCEKNTWEFGYTAVSVHRKDLKRYHSVSCGQNAGYPSASIAFLNAINDLFYDNGAYQDGKGNHSDVAVVIIPNAVNNSFWVTVFQADGRIDYDGLIQSTDKLYSKLLEAVFASKNDHAIIFTNDNLWDFSFIENNKTMHIRSIDHNDILDGNYLTSAKVSKLIKDPLVPIKKAIFGMGTLGVSLVLFFIYSWLSSSFYLNSIDNHRIANLSLDLNSYNENVKKYKNSSKWTPQLFKDLTIDAFAESIDDSLYSPRQVASILYFMGAQLPDVASEWTLSQLSYTNNSYYASYSRNEGSKGVYFLLDEVIKEVSVEVDGITLSPFSLNDDGNLRIYKVSPVDQPARHSSLNEITTQIQKKRALERAVAKGQSSILEIASRLNDLHDEIDNFSWWQLYLGGTLSDMDEDATSLYDSIPVQLEKLQRLMAQNDEVEASRINEEMVLGQVMDFVTIMQLDSMFDWSFPKLSAVIPNEDTLVKYNPKQRRNNRKDPKGQTSDNVKIYTPAIERYVVFITTLSSEEEGKVKTGGLIDLLSLGETINKPYVQIESVIFNNESKQWEVEITFYRKTPLFDEMGIAN